MENKSFFRYPKDVGEFFNNPFAIIMIAKADDRVSIILQTICLLCVPFSRFMIFVDRSVYIHRCKMILFIHEISILKRMDRKKAFYVK